MYVQSRPFKSGLSTTHQWFILHGREMLYLLGVGRKVDVFLGVKIHYEQSSVALFITEILTRG